MQTWVSIFIVIIVLIVILLIVLGIWYSVHQSAPPKSSNFGLGDAFYITDYNYKRLGVCLNGSVNNLVNTGQGITFKLNMVNGFHQFIDGMGRYLTVNHNVFGAFLGIEGSGTNLFMVDQVGSGYRLTPQGFGYLRVLEGSTACGGEIVSTTDETINNSTIFYFIR